MDAFPNGAALEGVLDACVRPLLRLHGGDLRVAGYDNGVLFVQLLGQCHGCPSADLTMTGIIREEVCRAFPEIRDVCAVSGVSDALMDDARSILKQRHAAAK